MVFICIYLGLIQSLKLEGLNAFFTIYPQKVSAILSVNTLDILLIRTTNVTRE